MPTFPFLTLLVSGGHTMLVLATSNSKFRILVDTTDEVAGHAYDKVGRLLGLEWGQKGLGAALEAFCDEPDPEADELIKISDNPFTLPVPKRMEFSFAGIHSRAQTYVAKMGLEKLSLSQRRVLGRQFQDVVVAHLEEKLLLSLKLMRSEGIFVNHVVVSGGVACNQYLRRR
jgi:N6-L-threonylcarbamoyladenine synthase